LTNTIRLAKIAFIIMSEIIKPIPTEFKPGWSIVTQQTPEAEPIPLDTAKLEATQTRMQVQVSYGQGPEGYDRFIIKEPNGGGSVTIPYVEIEGDIYIGVNRVGRSATGGSVLEVPRGFSLPIESHKITAQREVLEETGIKESLVERVKDLGGKPVNPNSTFFEANHRKDEGVKFFGLALKPDEVISAQRHSTEDPTRRVYKFTPELQGEITEANERIKPEGIRFFHADLLRNTNDGFTQIAIARILTASKPQRRNG
jgi:hypothetical protein